MIARVLCLALVLFAGPVELAAQGIGNGPFRVPEQHPIYGFFLTPRPERAALLPSGSVEVAFRTTYSNVFEFARRDAVQATFDYERWTNTAEIVWAARDGLEVGVRSAVVTGWGGFLDGLVQWYHQRLSLPNGDREDVENGDFEVSLVARGDSLVSLESGTHVADPVVWVALPIFRGSRALSARASLKLPFGSDDWSSGRVDVAVQLDGRHVFTNWATYGGVAVGTINAGPRLESYTPSSAVSLHLGVERRLGETWAVMAQLQGSSPFLQDLGHPELDRVPVNLGVGFTGRTRSGWLWQAAFTEDVRPDSPAVDFTIDLHLSRVLGGPARDGG
ncbi:MAG TPA: DUF3187 family protein, partial [Longimicrobiales bacterium]|nr:DUF3187 family protein [Longimicrobiales bacterium]